MKRQKSATKTTARPRAGLTERLARAAATHPLRTIAVFVLLIAAAVLGAGSLLGSGITSEASSAPASRTASPARDWSRTGSPASRR